MSKPGIRVTDGADERGRPIVFITQHHDLPPHHPTATIIVRAPSEMQDLLRRLKHRLDVMLEDRRARAQRPETCTSGGPVGRHLHLDELDGDE